jgi:hypothetical protein
VTRKAQSKGSAGSVQFVETATGVNAIITDGVNDGSGMGYSVHTVSLKSAHIAYENDKVTSGEYRIDKGISCDIPEQGNRDIPCYRVNTIKYWMPDNEKEGTSLSVHYAIGSDKRETSSFEGCSFTNNSGGPLPVCNAMNRKLGEQACVLVD